MRTLRTRHVLATRIPAVMSRDDMDGGDRSPGRSAIMRHLFSAALVLPRGTRWHELTSGQRAALVARGTFQLGTLAAALWDLRRRPADEIRGPKAVWVVVSGVNYLGMGPLAYFAFGRRRSSSGRRRT